MMAFSRNLVFLALIGLTALAPACEQFGDRADPSGKSSSRAYKGHENDADIGRLVAVYPGLAGSRLDDCRTCHAGREVTIRGLAQLRNPCDTCHFIPFPDTAVEGVPGSYAETLNAFGRAYLEGGRSEAALEALAGIDSDGDGFTNGEEIAGLHYPGAPTSKPGQPLARVRVLDLAALRALPVHTQLLLVNSHRQKNDCYSQYRGVTIADLLRSVGVDPNGVESVTVFSADGFQRDFSAGEIVGRFADGLFFGGLDEETLGADRGFVNYPPDLPVGLENGAPIPHEQRLMLAYQRDGGELDPSSLDPKSGRIDGEGPLRIVLPQSRPGAPDRGSRVSPTEFGDGFDYDESKDHNAGAMVRAVVALRVNPPPAGFEEFDTMAGGWRILADGELVIYGAGIE
ncbi:MAG: GEGP motif-containing diheme protein [Planctomycetota bacterium]